jgi:hypothetical protein
VFREFGEPVWGVVGSCEASVDRWSVSCKTVEESSNDSGTGWCIESISQDERVFIQRGREVVKTFLRNILESEKSEKKVFSVRICDVSDHCQKSEVRKRDTPFE